jgi:hypothetical protein
MSKDMDPKAKARLERDMANLRKQMKDLGKQLEKECGMKDFDPLKNMNPKYPFNIIPDKNKKKETPFGPNFPFNDSNNQPSNNPFGQGFPFNQPQTNPFGENNPFFENLFKNTNAYCFTPPPGFMENGFKFTPNGFEFDQDAFKHFKPQPNPFTSPTQNPFTSPTQNPFTSPTQNPFASQAQNPFASPDNLFNNYEPMSQPDFGNTSNSRGPIIEEIDENED